MSNISYNLQGDIGVGRGQLGLTAFATLAQQVSQFWITIGVDRPHYYFITPNGANTTVRLPTIGTADSQAQVGHNLIIKNIGAIILNVENSVGGSIINMASNSSAKIGRASCRERV